MEKYQLPVACLFTMAGRQKKREQAKHMVPVKGDQNRQVLGTYAGFNNSLKRNRLVYVDFKSVNDSFYWLVMLVSISWSRQSTISSSLRGVIGVG